MKQFSQEIVNIATGALVLTVLGVFFLWAYLVPSASSEGYTLTARFSRVDGITKGAEVRLLGVPVGMVAEQRLDPKNNMAYLDMTIRSDIEMPVDTTAMVLSDGVFAGKFVKLDPGGSYEMLADGDEIEFTQDSVILENIIERIVTGAEKRKAERNAGAGVD
ncbi:MAG: MCE family protein [Rhodospirillaceae bacterium]|jgi:phospholipid/cholesterol/gamma-HCH transport system substrate-binding protein|nr:MCE family protein [Rhodospirillaceae bacterium]MBT6118467.1 MCE family protein [Rhodospirillaceae bacterium]